MYVSLGSCQIRHLEEGARSDSPKARRGVGGQLSRDICQIRDTLRGGQCRYSEELLEDGRIPDRLGVFEIVAGQPCTLEEDKGQDERCVGITWLIGHKLLVSSKEGGVRCDRVVDDSSKHLPLWESLEV